MRRFEALATKRFAQQVICSHWRRALCRGNSLAIRTGQQRSEKEEGTEKKEEFRRSDRGKIAAYLLLYLLLIDGSRKKYISSPLLLPPSCGATLALYSYMRNAARRVQLRRVVSSLQTIRSARRSKVGIPTQHSMRRNSKLLGGYQHSP